MASSAVRKLQLIVMECRQIKMTGQNKKLSNLLLQPINEGQGPVKQHPLDDQDDHNKSNCVVGDSPSYFIISSLELGVV